LGESQIYQNEAENYCGEDYCDTSAMAGHFALLLGLEFHHIVSSKAICQICNSAMMFF